ncbi:MAG TPA: hypothetical protein VMY37_21055 [Thermoguttaceae bacterium]|nr:hypothetical protein [Thermoguttaceae bacterium]HUU85436.1 hypothetical protein [Phycisphaerae bacterium]
MSDLRFFAGRRRQSDGQRACFEVLDVFGHNVLLLPQSGHDWSGPEGAAPGGDRRFFRTAT